jgi:hypothetical protein
MTKHLVNRSHWPIVPDAEPEDVYYGDGGVRCELEHTTTAFLTLLWRQWQIAEKEAAKDLTPK